MIQLSDLHTVAQTQCSVVQLVSLAPLGRHTLEDVRRYLGRPSIVQTSNTYGHLVAGRSAEVAAGMDRAVIG